MATLPISPADPLGASHSKPKKSPARHICPHCSGEEVYRQRARGIIERHVVRAIRFFPFWCASCDRRFYLHEASSRSL
jgi:hypothetical protein